MIKPGEIYDDMYAFSLKNKILDQPETMICYRPLTLNQSTKSQTVEFTTVTTLILGLNECYYSTINLY